MDQLGLSTADFAKYVAHLRSPSIGVTIEARLLDLAGNLRESMLGVVGGTVNVDTTQTTTSTSSEALSAEKSTATRTATVILSDPGHAMAWDSDSPGLGAATINNQIRLDHVTYVPALGRRVVCPLITGPVDPEQGFTRSGSQVTINIVGRETLMMGQAWRTRTYGKGALRTDALKDIAWFYGGSSGSQIPSLSSRLPTPLSIGRTSVPWTAAQQLARSLDRSLIFNARGDLIARPHPAHPVMSLFEGDQDTHTSDLLGEFQITWGLKSGWFNVVEVTGDKPSVRAVAYPPPGSMLHPQNMGANGAWNVRLHQEQNPKIRTVSEAKSRADRLMSQQLTQSADVTAISKCFPFLQELDVVRFQTGSGDVWQTLTKFSIDLAGTGMSLGYNRRFHNLLAPRPGRSHR